MQLLRVTNWQKHYENNRTRELRKLDWVPVPNKMDGDGYTELVSHDDGAAHLGAWLAVIEIASRCTPRGTLIRGDGTPHAAASLARLSRLPEAVFVAAIPRLLKIGWLEITPQDDAGIPQAGAGLSQDGAGPSQDTAEGRDAGAGDTAPQQGAGLPAASRTLPRDCADDAQAIADTVDCAAPQDGAGTSAPYRTPVRESAHGREQKGREGNTQRACASEAKSKAVEAFDRWAHSARGYQLSEAHNEYRPIHALVDELADTPPIARGAELVPRVNLIPLAAETLERAGRPFRRIQFAVGAVRNTLEDWHREGVPGTGRRTPAPTVRRTPGFWREDN